VNKQIILFIVASIVVMGVVIYSYRPVVLSHVEPASIVSPHRTIVVMRHGQADHNISHRFNSDPASPRYVPAHLTDWGKKQIQKTIDELLDAGITGNSVVAVYASPLPRTQETAALVCGGLNIPAERLQIDNRLIEVQMGEKEGTKTYLLWSRTNAHQYGGETQEDVRNRVAEFLADIAKKHPSGTVIVVTHATPAGQLIAELGHYVPKPRQAQAEIIQFEPAGGRL
jgi:probable phosphoglycerate mutase